MLAQRFSLCGARLCPELGVKPTCRLNARTYHCAPQRTQPIPPLWCVQNPTDKLVWPKSSSKGESMKRREFLFSATAIAAIPKRLMAQSAPKAARIGWLTAQNEASLTPYLVVMRKGFADLGYIEGRTLTIEYRYGND